MKKILASLLVLAVCAPAMAATIDVVGGTLQATVTITADGAANIVGLGLDVDVDNGAVVTGVTVDTANFNIFPDAAYTQELGGDYVYGTGTPVAAKTVAGQIALPQSSFALSFGNLNGAAVAGADGAASVQVTLTVDKACNLTVCENATRGGIVAVDGTALVAACDTDAITAADTECVKATAPFYADWVAFGKPACWCYERHCRGDADGQIVAATKTVPAHWVGTPDLGILTLGWKKTNADPAFAQFICADFDKTEVAATKTVPAHRVGTPDLGLLTLSWKKVEAQTPPCDGANFNFWTN